MCIRVYTKLIEEGEQGSKGEREGGREGEREGGKEKWNQVLNNALTRSSCTSTLGPFQTHTILTDSNQFDAFLGNELEHKVKIDHLVCSEFRLFLVAADSLGRETLQQSNEHQPIAQISSVYRNERIDRRL